VCVAQPSQALITAQEVKITRLKEEIAEMDKVMEYVLKEPPIEELQRSRISASPYLTFLTATMMSGAIAESTPTLW
jgi:hypothetical protein